MYMLMSGHKLGILLTCRSSCSLTLEKTLSLAILLGCAKLVLEVQYCMAGSPISPAHSLVHL